jgi:carbon-monoxide dehydrogenase large subunit
MKQPEVFRHIGAQHLRKEDARLLTGQGRFIDDIEVPHALHACFVRSPHAHAKILSIDGQNALALEGVVAVFTGQDLAQWTTRHRMAPDIAGLKPMEMDTLPIDKVRFQGDPVACVIAKNRYIAEDAAALVQVDYEELPAVTPLEQALAADAPLVDPLVAGNLVSHQHASFGDLSGAHQQAHRMIESTFSQHRQTHLPIETRGCIALWDAGREHLEFHVGTQVPHPYRTTLSTRLKLSESQVTIVSPDVGGGFGQKIALYREELTVAAAANPKLRLRRQGGLVQQSGGRSHACAHVHHQLGDGWHLGRSGPRTQARSH